MTVVDEGNEIELVVRFYVDRRPRLGKPAKTGRLSNEVSGVGSTTSKKHIKEGFRSCFLFVHDFESPQRIAIGMNSRWGKSRRLRDASNYSAG